MLRNRVARSVIEYPCKRSRKDTPHHLRFRPSRLDWRCATHYSTPLQQVRRSIEDQIHQQRQSHNEVPIIRVLEEILVGGFIRRAFPGEGEQHRSLDELGCQMSRVGAEHDPDYRGIGVVAPTAVESDELHYAEHDVAGGK